MEKEIIDFILKNNLSILNDNNINIIHENINIFKTKDAKSVYTKTLSKISQNFIFKDSKNILDLFNFTNDLEQIKKRQEFIKFLIKEKIDNSFLNEIKTPHTFWKPQYGIVVVTENEKTFLELKKLDIPVKFINTSEDIVELENYDLIQAIDCEETSLILERLNQVVFISSIEDVYLERYLEILSGWKANLNILSKNSIPSDIKNIVDELLSLLLLINDPINEKIDIKKTEDILEQVNEEINEKVKNLNISGQELIQILSNKSLTNELKIIIDEAISKTSLPEEIFNKNIPLTIDEKILSKVIKEQEANEYTAVAEKIKRKAEDLKKIPSKLQKLSNLLLVFDFYAGISRFIELDYIFPEVSNELKIIDSKNIFLDNPEAISFLLNEESKCSILTGANSGGKTTLLEHVIQLITLTQLGLPLSGKVSMPLFEEVYYFAKTKGSASKGAFETLLNQMSKIKPGNKTIILADEIESVTEPGIAGKILCATSDFFIQKNCFLIIATHLGQEIQPNLPKLARIDGIEAKGLDENYNLIVHHNPILGRLAHSTPELIVEKMANTPKTKNEYIEYIWKFLKK